MSRTERELHRAHDILIAVITGELPDRRKLMATRRGSHKVSR